jgi:predicted MFS family arabinose efflux permease
MTMHYPLASGTAPGGRSVSVIAADLFAGRQFGTIFGLITVGHGIGGALGPWVGWAVYDRFGSDTLALVFALVVLCGAVGCFGRLRDVWPRQLKRHGPQAGRPPPGQTGARVRG